MPHDNACQGLPDGPCPIQQQDNSVVFTIYDLILCPSCSQAREQFAKQSGGSIATAGNKSQAKTTKSRGRKADATVTAHSTRQSKQIQNTVNLRIDTTFEHAAAGQKDE
jgi:hypothetical protein